MVCSGKIKHRHNTKESKVVSSLGHLCTPEDRVCGLGWVVCFFDARASLRMRVSVKATGSVKHVCASNHKDICVCGIVPRPFTSVGVDRL